MFSALDRLVEKIERARKGPGPVSLLDSSTAYLSLDWDWSAVCSRYVWGRVMTPEDEWSQMPTFRSWRIANAVTGDEKDSVTLVLAESSPAPSSEDLPWGTLRAWILPRLASPEVCEVYEVLREDGLPSQEAMDLAELLVKEECSAHRPC